MYINNNPLISFSGAQSTGKTTLLNILKDHNSHISFIPEVTRKIKHEYGVPINEYGSSLTQSLIISEHIKNVFSHRRDNKPTILDRCIIDGYIYTDWFRRHSNHPDWVTEFAKDTLYNIIHGYDIIFYTNPLDVELVDDGERSNNYIFRSQIIEMFESFIEQYNRNFYNRNYIKSVEIVKLSGTVKERLRTIKQTCKDLCNLDIKIS